MASVQCKFHPPSAFFSEKLVLQEAASSPQTFVNETQQCFAIKAGQSDFLDLARVAFSSTTEAIHSLVDKYKTDHGLDSLKVRQPFHSAQSHKQICGLAQTLCNCLNSLETMPWCA